MARFTQAELQTYYGVSVPDLLPADDQPLRLLFVGINPGLWTAATQTHFAHPLNRFYPALFRAGITPAQVDAAAGMTDQQRAYFRSRGIGFTNIVRRATAKASELDADELKEGGAELFSLIARRKPTVVAIAGITAYRTAFNRPKAKQGLQPEPLAGAELWVVPNPSGLNAHETVTSLADAYAAPARAAALL